MKEEMKEILAAIKGHGEALEKQGADVEEKLKRLDAIDTLETRFKEMETKFKAVNSKMVDLPGVDEGKENFSFLKAFAGMTTKDWSNAGFEKEVFDQTRKRALDTGAGTTGGFIVPNQYIAEIIELLRAESVVMGMGATVLSGLVGSPVEIPKQTGGATAYWVGENSAITESQQAFGQLDLTPKQVAAMVKMSSRFMNLSDPSGEAMVRRDLAQVIALAIDLAALRGTGSSTQPLGIVNTPGISEVEIDTNGGAFSWDIASQMEGKLEDSNALRGRLGYVTHPKVKRLLKRLRIPQFSGQTDGEYIFNPVMSDAQLDAQLGTPIRSTTQLPVNLEKGSSGAVCSEVIFGNWQELIVGQWGGLEFMASSETSDAFAKNQTWIRVIQEVDVALRHTESFCLVNDAIITGA